MTIDRRRALAALVAAFGGVEWGKWLGLAPKAHGDSFALIGAEPASAGQDTATRDLSQIGAHVYSEEGIPMFLGCENTVAPGVSPPTVGKASDLNRKVSRAFERYVQEWRRLHPHAPADDAAKLVEFIAGRDLTSGGSETSL